MIWLFVGGGIFGVFCLLLGYAIGRISLLPTLPEDE